MRIVVSIVIAVVAFFATSEMTQSILSTRSDDSAASAILGESSLPKGWQRSLDKSNAELNKKLQAVMDANREHQLRGMEIMNGGNKKARRKYYGNSYTSRSTPVNNPVSKGKTQPIESGSVSSNPYAK